MMKLPKERDPLMTHSNPYVDHLMQKGYTESELRQPAAKADYPRTVHGRTFETEADYLDAIYDMLNGM